MIAKAFLLLVTLLGLCASRAHAAASMTTKNGNVIDLDKLYQESKGKCCRSAQEIGLVKVDGDNTVVRMDGSNGKYFVTNDPSCGNVIYSSSYPTSFSYIYLCGQCKGGCPKVEGGKTLVPQGGACTNPDGSTNINLVCISSAPVCLTATKKCGTFAEAQAPTPAPAPVACASFSNLGQSCNLSQGQCCGGGPKNAKCENGKCVTTFPTPAPAPAPAPVACASFSNLGQSCNLSQGQCCGGGPKNAKCENGKCVTTYPTGRKFF